MTREMTIQELVARAKREEEREAHKAARVSHVAVDSCICEGGSVRRDCWAEEHRSEEHR